MKAHQIKLWCVGIFGNLEGTPREKLLTPDHDFLTASNDGHGESVWTKLPGQNCKLGHFRVDQMSSNSLHWCKL
jgi:hypothetical protein